MSSNSFAFAQKSVYDFGAGQPATNIPTDAIIYSGKAEQQKATVPFWDDPPAILEASNNNLNPWDVVKFCGAPLPGICRVSSKTHSRYQIKTVKGQNFSTLTFQGYDPCEVIIENRIWSKVQLNMLAAQLPGLLPKFGPNNIKTTNNAALLQSLALAIYHPGLALYGISAVIILDIDVLTQTSQPGVFQQKFHCIQYVPVLSKGKANRTATAAGILYGPDVPSVNLGGPRPLTPPSQGSAVQPAGIP